MAGKLARKPVLLVNGADDLDVPPSQSAELYGAMLAAAKARTPAALAAFGQTHSLYVAPKEGHAGFTLFLKPGVWARVAKTLREC